MSDQRQHNETHADYIERKTAEWLRRDVRDAFQMQFGFKPEVDLRNETTMGRLTGGGRGDIRIMVIHDGWATSVTISVHRFVPFPGEEPPAFSYRDYGAWTERYNEWGRFRMGLLQDAIMELMRQWGQKPRDGAPGRSDGEGGGE